MILQKWIPKNIQISDVSHQIKSPNDQLKYLAGSDDFSSLGSYRIKTFRSLKHSSK